MENHLQPINALLGLLLPNDVLPPVLLHAGFSLVGLEIPVTVSPGKSVVIDCLLLHAGTSHLVCVESKSGGNVEDDQALKYSQLQPRAVVQAGYVNLPVRAQPTVEVVYLCRAENLERVRLGLDSLGLRYPIISVGVDHISLNLAEPAGEQLSAVFVGESIALPGPPPRLLLFDQDSDVDIIRPRVLAELVAAMANRLTQVGLVSLAERATPHYALYGRAAQQQIRRKVGDAARRIAEEEPTSFEYIPPAGNREGLVRILKTPEGYDARGRTQAYQAVGRRHKPSKRVHRGVTNPDQLDLLSELDTADNEDDGNAAESGEEVNRDV